MDLLQSLHTWTLGQRGEMTEGPMMAKINLNWARPHPLILPKTIKSAQTLWEYFNKNSPTIFIQLLTFIGSRDAT